MSEGMSTDRPDFRLIKWELQLCHVGKKCWCRIVQTVDGREVIDEGRVDREVAQYIVELHNNTLAVTGGEGE